MSENSPQLVIASNTPTVDPYMRLLETFTPESFYGSQLWVKKILEGISDPDPKSIELLGLPGSGKSTLLRYLAHPQGALTQARRWLQEPFQSSPQRVLWLKVDCRLRPLEMHPLVYLRQQCASAYAIQQQEAQDLPLSLPPWDTLVAEDAASPPIRLPRSSRGKQTGRGHGAPQVSIAATVLTTALRQLGTQGFRVVLLLDDFHLAFADMTIDHTELMRPWRRYAAFILTTERPLHEVNPEASGSPFFSMMPLERLGGLAHPEAQRLLSEPAAKASCPFPEADIAYVIDEVGTHPYLLIRAGTALWETRQQLGLLPENRACDSVQRQVLRGDLQVRCQRTFMLYWQHMNPHEQALLVKLGTAEPSPPRLYSTADYATLAALAHLGLVKCEASRVETPQGAEHTQTNSYSLFSPLFAEFLAGLSPGAPLGAALTAVASPALGLEATLYQYFREHAERVCTFEELAAAGWQESLPPGEVSPAWRRRIQVTVARLRSKLVETHGEDIRSVRKQGYQLILPR